MNTPIPDDPSTDCNVPYYDKMCKTTFPSFDAFHDHKVRSKTHITCDVCSVDYRTYESLARHRKELHPLEQNLQCPGCHKIFTRLGGWVSHIEQSECETLKKTKYKFEIKDGEFDKMDQAESRRAMRHLLEYGRTSGDFEDEEEMPKFEDDDLLSFDEPSRILNANWGTVVAGYKDKFPPLLNNNDTASTATGLTSRPIPIVEPENSWYIHRPLSPVTTANRIINGPPSKPSPTIEPHTIFGPHDPENPEFKAERYYVDVLRKFRCPHFGCKKSFASENAFVQHLTSSAHKANLRLQCNTCHRYFNDATALTQHSEAQGVRCKVRETDEYDAEVFRFTAGTAAAAGRLEDNTVKYAMTEAYKVQQAHDIADAHRATTATLIEAENTFWDRHEPMW